MSIQNDQRDYIKDYSLLRDFNLEAVKNGYDMLYNLNGELKDCSYITHHLKPVEEYIFNIKGHGFIVVGAVCSDTHYNTLGCVKIKPLAWVEGKPVYKGDVLYYKKDILSLAGVPRTIKELSVFSKDGVSFEEEPDGIYNWAYTSDLTWDKPKVKKEGWINIYKNGTVYLHNTEEDAIKGDIKFRSNWDHAPDFVTTVRIEYEV